MRIHQETLQGADRSLALPEKMMFKQDKNGVMWLKQCHKPSMTGNGFNPTYLLNEIGDCLFLFYQH
jgi:hypothetical protein